MQGVVHLNVSLILVIEITIVRIQPRRQPLWEQNPHIHVPESRERECALACLTEFHTPLYEGVDLLTPIPGIRRTYWPVLYSTSTFFVQKLNPGPGKLQL